MTIQLQSVEVLDNPAPFTDEFKFRITFDCISPGVKEELEWKLVYVGSADNENNDQELDSILVGPVRVGKNRFTFTAPAPDPSMIPKSDLLDVTVVLLTCLYKDQEFIRIGYYVHNEYSEPLNDDNSTDIIPEKIQRNILADKPRVTRFNIAWDNDQCNKENQFKPLQKKETNGDNNNNEMKDNDEQYYDDEGDDDDDDDDDDDGEVDLDAIDDDEVEEEEEEEIEEIDDDEDIEQNVMEQQGNNNNDMNDEDDDDEDIDMTE